MKKTSQTSPKKSQKGQKLFSIRKKLLLIILPLFFVSFAVTTALIFVNSAQTILSNSKHALEQEASSNAKTVTLYLYDTAGTADPAEAYKSMTMKPASLKALYEKVTSIEFMDGGNVMLVDNRSTKILANVDESVVDTQMSDCGADTFLGGIAALMESGETSIQSVSDGLTSYYVIVSNIDGTNWALVSYIAESYLLSDLANLLYVIIGIFAVVFVIVLVCVSFAISRMLSPIKGLTGALTTIADGDFTVEINAKGNDEIAVMSRSLKDFVAVMREVIADIRNVSDQLSHASDSTKAIAATLNEGATSQADSMSDVEVTLDQVAQGVQELAEHAGSLSGIVTDTNAQGEQVSSNMQATVNVAGQGREDMEGVNRTMASIVDAMRQLESIVTKVGESTEQINSMVSLISDISDQTNLLSLNAAIEAARAGDAGRGFAVVAEEIRKLAEISASSASQIGDIITQVNDEVSTMVERTSESVTYIEENSAKITASCQIFEHIYQDVDAANGLLTSMVQQIGKVDGIASNIAALSEEQSASTQEILASTQMLSGTALKVSEDSQKVASSAEELSAASFTLAEHMRRFKI